MKKYIFRFLLWIGFALINLALKSTSVKKSSQTLCRMKHTTLSLISVIQIYEDDISSEICETEENINYGEEEEKQTEQSEEN